MKTWTKVGMALALVLVGCKGGRNPVQLKVEIAGHGTVDNPALGLDCNWITPAAGCTFEADDASEVEVSAEPDPGWVLDHWEGVSCPDLTQPCQFKAAAGLTVKAVFVQEAPLHIIVTGQGTVSGPAAAEECDPSNSPCLTDYKGGQTLTAHAEAGSHFVRWAQGCATMDTSGTVTLPSPPLELTCEAQFATSVTFNVHFVVSGNGIIKLGGTTACDASNGAGCTVHYSGGEVYTEAPVAGNHFVHWAQDCASASTATSVTLPAAIKDLVCEADFVSSAPLTTTLLTIPATEVIAQSEIHLCGANLCFGANEIPSGGGSGPAPSDLQAAPIAGGASSPTELGATASGFNKIDSLVAGDSAAAVLTQQGKILAAPFAGGGLVSLDTTSRQYAAIAAYGTKAYALSIDNKLFSVPLDHSAAPTELTTGISITNPQSVAADANGIIFTTNSGANLYSLPLAGGTATAIPKGSTQMAFISLDSNNVYFTNAQGQVGQVSRSTGSITTLSTGENHPGSLTSDGAFVYWVDYGNSSNTAPFFQSGTGAVMMAPIGGGAAASAVKSGLDLPFGIAVDAGSVYWSSVIDGTLSKQNKP